MIIGQSCFRFFFRLFNCQIRGKHSRCYNSSSGLDRNKLIRCQPVHIKNKEGHHQRQVSLQIICQIVFQILSNCISIFIKLYFKFYQIEFQILSNCISKSFFRSSLPLLHQHQCQRRISLRRRIYAIQQSYTETLFASFSKSF